MTAGPSTAAVKGSTATPAPTPKGSTPAPTPKGAGTPVPSTPDAAGDGSNSRETKAVSSTKGKDRAPPLFDPSIASYATSMTSDELPPAFSWRRARAAGYTPSYVKPTPRKDDEDDTAQAALLAAERNPPYRPAHSVDYGIYPLLTASSNTPPALVQASLQSYLREPLPPARPPPPTQQEGGPVIDPLLPASLFDRGPVVAAQQQAHHAARGAECVREMSYGGYIGEAYASSLEMFLREGGVEGEAKEWIEDEVVRGVFGMGALGFVRRIARVLWDRGHGEEGEKEGPPTATATASGVVKKEAEVVTAMDVDEPQSPLSPPSTSNKMTDAALRAMALQTIEDLPLRRLRQQHLLTLARLPVSLPLLLRHPTEMAATIPASTLKRKRQQQQQVAAGGPVDEPPPTVARGPEWIARTLEAIGEELVGLAEEQAEEREAKLIKSEDGLAKPAAPAKPEPEDARLRRIRLLLVSLRCRAAERDSSSNLADQPTNRPDRPLVRNSSRSPSSSCSRTWSGSRRLSSSSSRPGQ